MLKSLTLTGLAFAGIVASSVASAELVSADDGFAVYDTGTSTFWMNLRETAGLSTATLFAEMEDGGKYDGWRLAAPEEIYEMWSLNVDGYVENKHIGSYEIDYSTKTEWRALFGATEDGNSSAFYYDGKNWLIGGVYRDGYPQGGETIFMTESRKGAYNSFATAGYDYYGHYLIYDGQLSVDANIAEDVPLPFLGMGALGLFALGFGRKRSV
jgi:hypothetical protein